MPVRHEQRLPLSLERVAHAADSLGLERRTKDGDLLIKLRPMTWLVVHPDDGGVWSEARIGRLRYPLGVYLRAIAVGAIAPLAFRAWAHFQWFRGGERDFLYAVVIFAFVYLLFELFYAPLHLAWSRKRLFEQAQGTT